MGNLKWNELHLTSWQRRMLVGILVALTGQLYLSLWAEGFRISSAVVLYPVLLSALMRESRQPWAGVVTGLCVLV